MTDFAMEIDDLKRDAEIDRLAIEELKGQVNDLKAFNRMWTNDNNVLHNRIDKAKLLLGEWKIGNAFIAEVIDILDGK